LNKPCDSGPAGDLISSIETINRISAEYELKLRRADEIYIEIVAEKILDFIDYFSNVAT
jgi:hypothetical protein